jgi:hypothetical protein
LANTSIAQYRDILADWILNNPSPPLHSNWFDLLMMKWRFQGDPLPEKPLSPDGIARTTPAFLQHCSQFIVEFAGDYLTQQNDPANASTYGNIVEFGPDNVVDYRVDRTDPTRPLPVMRWYGFPRDVAGGADGGPDGTIRGPINTADPNLLIDVVPLKDVMDVAGAMFNQVPPEQFIERIAPTQRQFYATPDGGGMTFTENALYVAAWGPDTNTAGVKVQPLPQLIRIVYTIDDPTGRVADGQTFEQVLKVGG